MIGAIGEEIELPCSAEGAHGVTGMVQWEKVNGQLPYAYIIRDGKLLLRDLLRKDEGVYKCMVSTSSGLATVTHVRLKISDFVPRFLGDGYLEIKPLSDEQWLNLNMKVSVKPQLGDGLIFYSSRKDSNDEVIKQISLGLRSGHVVYRFDFGDGSREVKSSYPLRLNEWHQIEVRHTSNRVTLIIDSDDYNHLESTQFSTDASVAGLFSLGGTKHSDALEQSGFPTPFRGAISALSIADQPIDIGDELLDKADSVIQDVECASNRCQNGGLCLPSNVHRGFICDCSTSADYGGRFCERKLIPCSENCIHGTCTAQLNGTKTCKCPPGRYGNQCQLLSADHPLKSIQFNGQNSYLILPTPPTLRNFSLRLELQLHGTHDQLIAYVASDYSSNKANYLALAIRNGKFLHIFNNGDGNMEIESMEPVELGRVYNLDLKRFGHRAEFRIDGKKVPSRHKLAPFLAGTEFFIGGIPPGILVNPKIGAAGPLKACISKIVLNGRTLKLQELAEHSSNAVTGCTHQETPTEVSVTQPETSSTTTSTEPTRTIVKTTTTTTTTTTATTTTTTEAEATVGLSTCAEGDCPLNKCDSNICGEHGDCETINATHIACSCRDYYDGPNCEYFKPIEHAAKFDGKAFIVFSSDEFPHLSSERDENVELRFKTNASYGLIFWQGQQPGTPLIGEDYMSLGLNDGYLIFLFELGGGAAQLISPAPVNDGIEHHVRIWRKGRNGTMTIDSRPPITGTSSGILAMLNVEGDIYIGGVPDLDDMTGGLHTENFVGCIGDVTFNGIKMDLMANAIDGRNVKPCDQWMVHRRWLRNRKYRHHYQVLF